MVEVIVDVALWDWASANRTVNSVRLRGCAWAMKVRTMSLRTLIRSVIILNMLYTDLWMAYRRERWQDAATHTEP